MYPTIIFLTTLLATTATSFIIVDNPPTEPQPHLLNRDTTAPNPVTQLISIAPASSTCTGAKYTSECATASSAVMPIIASFAKYGVTTAPEQAALLSWMAFESGDFKYNINHFPGTPGQGTRCMMSPKFVAEYASSIPSVASQTSGKSPADVLALVSSDEYSFASAAWFYSTKCSASIKKGVQSGSRAGWASFLSTCVSTTVDEGSGDASREAYWKRAMAALSAPVS